MATVKPRSIAEVSLGLTKGEPDFRVLYKFQRIRSYSLDALSRRYLYFSSFHQLNDPFDPFLTLIAMQAGDVAIAYSREGSLRFSA